MYQDNQSGKLQITLQKVISMIDREDSEGVRRNQKDSKGVKRIQKELERADDLQWFDWLV